MKAHLADLAASPESPAFRTCQRVYNRVQRILFEDPEDTNDAPRRSVLPFLPLFEARRPVYPRHARSALVGAASVLAAAGCPSYAAYGASLALQQGRRVPEGVLESAAVREASEEAPAAPAPPAPAHAPDDIGAVFGQNEPADEPAAPAIPALTTTPRLSAHTYAQQQQFLRSHYGRTEMQFLQTLQDIPMRLQQLPKPARLSALRAELTALNHTLPTEACFPTWCAGTPDGAAHSERHHRIVRISASEAVVLNSADRVPYLLHVEVVRNDLDFDPNRRYNRELLQRIHQNAARPLRRGAPPPPQQPAPPLRPALAPATEASLADAEVDLTEQMYGADLGAFGRAPAADEHEHGLDAKNVSLDTAAWAHATAPTPTPGRYDFSLEEYAQRMRTAAVMLAQLNRGGAGPSEVVGRPAPGAPEVPALVPGSGGVAASSGGSTSGTRVSHADANVIRQRIMDEMMALEEQRMERMKRGGAFFERQKRNHMAAEDENAVLRAVNKEDPSAAHFRESWTTKRERIRASSPYGDLPAWDLFSVIVKTGADLRQEQFAVQLINEFRRVWLESRSRCWVHYFRIVVLNESAGLIETITDAVSVHSIKKDAYARQLDGQPIATFSLYDHYVQTYGEPHTAAFAAARRAFSESLAGYAIVSYLLQIKDRHNGNILVDAQGHIIRTSAPLPPTDPDIDFGFILGLSPGGVGFEAAPFKFPRDYIDILGGMDSEGYHEFRMLMRQGFRDARKHAERFILLVELMQRESHLPCFSLGDAAAAQLRDRFQLGLTAPQCDEFVDRLVLSAAGSAFTRLYDQYQNFTQNIL